MTLPMRIGSFNSAMSCLTIDSFPGLIPWTHADTANRTWCV